MTATRIIQAAAAESCHPWPRHILTPANWAVMAGQLAAEPDLALLALWAESTHVHAQLLSEEDGFPLLASVPIEDGQFPALSPARPNAVLFERAIHDLWGHVASGAVDTRPWLDHGAWPNTAPLSGRPGPPPAEQAIPEFAPSVLAATQAGLASQRPVSRHAPPAEPEGLSQLPLGPVHGGIDGAWHLRLTLRGETILQAEARLGYAHKGILALMRGKSPRVAARFVARLAAESTVAHALAFALAVEAALAVAAPPRAAVLRRLMLELERIAVHLDDLARIADAVDVRSAVAICGEQREYLLRGLEVAFGHRLMMDVVVPGGIAGEVTPAALIALRRSLGSFAGALPGLSRRLASSGYLDRLTGLGRLTHRDAVMLGLGGVAGRGCGRPFDARSLRPDGGFTSVTSPDGDAACRARLRVAGIQTSLLLIGRLLDMMPDGENSVALPMLSGEGVGCAESARGDVWHWLRLDHGQIAAAFPRDPAWALWPAAERALAGAPLQDAPAIQRSFGLSAAGMDL